MSRPTDRSNTFQIALGGICLALTMAFMFGGSFLPGIDLTLFAIASAFTAVMVIETGIGGGLLLYAAACLLGFFLVPGKLALIPYVFFFGYWAIPKYYIEKISAPVGQIACKCAVFLILLSAGLLGFRQFLASAITLPEYPVILLMAAGVLLLLLYDYILSCVINWYYRRFKGAGAQHLKLS